MYYSNRTKYGYSESLKCIADTVLYEMALKFIEKVEKNKGSPLEECHWKNAAIYSEFWRRNKQDIYQEAFMVIQRDMGYKK